MLFRMKWGSPNAVDHFVCVTCRGFSFHVGRGMMGAYIPHGSPPLFLQYPTTLRCMRIVRRVPPPLCDFRNYNQELAGLRRQVIDLREAKDEEAGRWEFEKNKLKADLEIAIQKSKVILVAPLFRCSRGPIADYTNPSG